MRRGAASTNLPRTDDFREAVEREFPSAVMDFENDGLEPAEFPPADGRVDGAGRGIWMLGAARARRSFPTSASPSRSSRACRCYFATAMPLNGYGYGVLAESHEGRPTKIEGNPDHPARLGADEHFHAGVGPATV